MTEWAGRDLDTQRVAVLGVTGSERAPGPQVLEIADVEAVAGQEQLAVLSERGMAIGENEPIPAGMSTSAVRPSRAVLSIVVIRASG